jgi:hypothetical protein
MRRSLIAASSVVAVGGAMAFAAAPAASAASLTPTVNSNYAAAQGLTAISYDTILEYDQAVSMGSPDTAITPTSALQAFISTDGSITTQAEITSDVTPAFAAAVWATLAGANLTAGSSNSDAGDDWAQVAESFYGSLSAEPSSLQQLSTVASTYGLIPLLATPSTVTASSSDAIDLSATAVGSLAPLVALEADDPTDFPNGLFSVDGDVNISSSATVTAIGKPTAYSETFGVSSAASGGYVLPSGFTLTFPADFSINTALVGAEITAAQESNPPAASAIGTASITSPAIAALVPGSKGVDSTAAVYVVATSSLTQPDFEVYLGQNDYILGTLTGVTFPLTVTFGEPVVGGQASPLPVSSVSLNFPAATSPLEATSCTDLGSLTGTMTDGASAVATLAGDTSDSGSLNMTATPTVVTDDCTAAVATVKNTLSASMGGLTGGTPTLSFKVGTTGTAFSTVTVGLPSGLKFAKSKKLAKEVSGSKIKSVKIAGGKLVITLKSKVKSETIKTKKGLINESASLIKKIKKHKTKKLNLSVKAGTFTVKASVKA